MAPLSLALTLCACGSQHPAVPSPGSRGAAGVQPSVLGEGDLRPAAVARASDAFAVLHRPRTHADGLPARAIESVRRSSARHLAGDLVLDPRSARLVSLPGAPPIWVLGGGDAICLLTAEPPADGRAFEFALGCLPAELARRGELVRTYTEV